MQVRSRSAIALIFGALAMSGVAQAQQDLRSPDTRDHAARAESHAARQDLRSPDARDVGARAPRDTQPSPAAAPSAGASNAFDWGAAAIGAGVAGALGLAAAAAVTGRRRWHDGVVT
jgi:hypothetical protein